MVIVLFRFRTAMAFTFLLFIVIGGTILLNLTPLYEAKSILLVKIGREYQNRSDLNANAPLMSLSEAEVVNSEMQILTNAESLRKTIASVGLKRFYPDLASGRGSVEDRMATAVERFKESLKAEAVKQSNVIEVSFQHPDPAVAAQAVNILVDLFKEKHLEVFSGPKYAMVQAQLDQYRQKLDKSEQNLKDYKQQNKVFSLNEQRTLLLNQRYAIDASLKSTVAGIGELEQKLPTLKANLERIGHTVTPNSQPDKEAAIDATKAQLMSMQLEEQQLLKKYTEASPMVVSYRKEMAVVKAYLKDQETALARKTGIGGPMYQAVQMDVVKTQTDLASLRARAASLREQLRDVDGQVAALDKNENTLQQLTLQQAIDQKSYETMVAKAEETRISEFMDRNKLANISVIESATEPIEPVSPKKGEFLLRVVAIALASSAAVPFLLKGLTPGMATPEAVEQRLGLRVLGSISHTGRS